MKTASALSVTLHAAVLAWAMLSFSGKTLDAPPVEALPVDLMSTEDFTKLTKGAKDAPKKEEPKPLVEKKAEAPKPVEETKPKITEKKEIAPTQAAAPPPPPEPKTDPIAEKIEKAEEPKPQQVAQPQPMPLKRPPMPKQPKFDADKIAALLDKRDAQRSAATGEQVNSAPSLGASQGSGKQLSASELDALRARLHQCWNPPIGVAEADKAFVVFRVLLRRDGSIAQDPVLVEAPASKVGPVLADSAKRALLQCQPYKMLKIEHYDAWKDLEIKFDPRDMFRG